MNPELFIQQNAELLLIVTLWSLPWKGVALWRAAQRGDRGWFIALLLLNTAALLEMVYLFYISKRPSDREVEAVLAEQEMRHEHDDDDPIDAWLNRKADVKEEIVSMIAEKGRLTLSEIEKAFEMPAAAVSNFIEELLVEERIEESVGEDERTFISKIAPVSAELS